MAKQIQGVPVSVLMASLRGTDGVKTVKFAKGWIAVRAETASRARGLADTIAEAGFKVRQRQDILVFC